MHALVLQLLRALVDSNTLPLTCWRDLGESVMLGFVVNAVPSKLSDFMCIWKGFSQLRILGVAGIPT